MTQKELLPESIDLSVIKHKYIVESYVTDGMTPILFLHNNMKKQCKVAFAVAFRNLIKLHKVHNVYQGGISADTIVYSNVKSSCFFTDWSMSIYLKDYKDQSERYSSRYYGVFNLN